jgi:subtilisin family serine protease
MKSRFVSVLALVLLSATSVFALETVPGELIVKYREGSIRELATMRSLYAGAQVQKVRRFGNMMRGFEHLQIADQANTAEVIRLLETHPYVEYAVENVRVPSQRMATPCLIPGFPPGCDSTSAPPAEDPPPARRPTVGALPREPLPAADSDLSRMYGLTKIDAVAAWSLQPTAKDVVVAVIDSGVDYNHEDLALNLWRNPRVDSAKKDFVGYDFFHDDGLPYDDVITALGRGHGTHVAGILGAVGNNGIGISGVAPRVSLMILKVLHSEAGGTLADVIRAYEYAVKNGAKILNNSWALTADVSEERGRLLPMREAIHRAGQAGALSVFASGNGDDRGNGVDNDGSRRGYPASFNEPSIISVAASDAQDRIGAFSNFGRTTVHLAAPGVDILSLVPSNLKYGMRSGTSMAAPHVSGAAALVWAKNPTWDLARVKEALLSSVDTVADTRIRTQTVTGGRLNVRRALEVR